MQLHDPLLRLHARQSRKSVVTRATAAVTRQLPILGLVVIQVTGDHRIQAIAVGPLDCPPTVEILRDPYQQGQEDFAVVSARISELLSEHPWQIWIADEAAWRVCGLEGLRNRRNLSSPSYRKTLAKICYAIHREAERPGQQVVVVATEVLAQHLTTGQSPTEDAHLGARLAWDNPEPGEHPSRVAEARRVRSGPTLLPFEDDQEIEVIRARAFREKATSADLQRIDDVLHEAALHGWRVLQEAHQVYERLDIPDLPGVEELINQSLKDFAWLLNVSPAFGATSQSALHEFRTREHLHQVYEDLNARGDRVVRERLRQEGRVIGATLLRVTPARKKRGVPCWLLLSTTQAVRRFRVGTQLKTQDNATVARVERIRNTAEGVLVLLRVTRGVTAARSLTVPSQLDWFDTVVFNSAPWMKGGRRGAF